MERAAEVEEIVISKAGKLMAKLVPYAMSAPPRTGGFLSGKIWESPAPWEPYEELISAMTTAPLFTELPAASIAENPAEYGKRS